MAQDLITKYQVEVFNRDTGEQEWEFEFDTVEDAENEIDCWDFIDYEVNYKVITYPIIEQLTLDLV